MKTTCPKITPRRPYSDEHPTGYLESDRDFVLNNLEAALWLLSWRLCKNQQKES